MVGFAAETGDATADVLELGRAKLARKGCDVLVVNDVSAGKVFGSDLTRVWVLTRDDEVAASDSRSQRSAEPLPVEGSKAAVAHLILDEVSARLDPAL